MKKTTKLVNIEPTIGEGIFLIKDVAEILGLPHHTVRRWIHEYWDGRFSKEAGGVYSFGEVGNKAVNFYSLIEFYVFYKLRERKISSQQIHKAHHAIAVHLKTPYPFAHSEISTLGKGIWYKKFDSIFRADGKQQATISEILEPFLEKVDYGKNKLAERFYPLAKSKNIVVDPKHQFGQPTIAATNIKSHTIYNLVLGGEKIKTISNLYDISEKKVKDAIAFHKKVA